MALTGTTLAAVCALGDTKITVTSATGFAAGYTVRIDNEFSVVDSSYVSGTTIPLRSRGKEGTAVAAHGLLAFVVVGLASDFVDVSPGNLVNVPPTNQNIVSYSTAGAIAIPITDTIVDINSTGAVVALTLANPAKTQNGLRMTLTASSTGAHTVTYSTGFFGGSGSNDIATWDGSLGQSMSLLAFNGLWGVTAMTSGVTVA